jgi:hypothetical protein
MRFILIGLFLAFCVLIWFLSDIHNEWRDHGDD